MNSRFVCDGDPTPFVWDRFHSIWGALLLTLAGVTVFFCLATEAVAGPGEDNVEPRDSIRYNIPESNRLSKRLRTTIKVYDTDWFQIITCKSYSEKIKDDIAPKVVDAVAEFCDFFGVDPKSPFWKGGQGGTVPGQLVFLRDREAFKRYVDLLEYDHGGDELGDAFAEGVMFAQSFSIYKPIPVAAACGADAHTGDSDALREASDYSVVTQHVFHLLGHLLLTLLDFNNINPPPWLHEGYGEYLAIRYAGGNILYCTCGLNDNTFGTGVFSGSSAWARSENWISRFRQSSYLQEALKLGELNELPIDDFTHPDAAHAWSVTAFLIEQHPEHFKNYVLSLKKPKALASAEGIWTGAEYSAEMFEKAFDKNFEQIEEEWKEWASNADNQTGMLSENSIKRSKSATVRFHPYVHLEEYRELSAKQPETLERFKERSGEWMRPSEAGTIIADWEEERAKLQSSMAKARAEMLNREAVSIDDVMDRVVVRKSARFLDPEEVGGLIKPDLEESVFRSVVSFYVDEYGCMGAWKRLEERLKPIQDRLKSQGLENDIELLKEACLFERKILEGLAKKKAYLSLDFWSGKLKIVGMEGDLLICEGRAPKSGIMPEMPSCCNFTRKGKDVRIVCPVSCVNTKSLLIAEKKSLKLSKDESGRVGRAQMLLFRGDAGGARKELKFVKADKKREEMIRNLLECYENTQKSVELLRLFMGQDEGSIQEQHDKLFTLLAGVKGTPLIKALNTRGKGVASRILLEHYLTGNQFLRSFKGFKGTEGNSGATFMYTFENPEEFQDFDQHEPLLVEHLYKRHKLDPMPGADGFQVVDRSLLCYGTDFIALTPIFRGDIELRIRLRVSVKEGVESTGGWYTLFGYGLDELGGYIGSSCLAYMEFQEKIGRPYRLEHAIMELGEIQGTESYDTIIKGTKDQVSMTFASNDEVVYKHKGQRKGQVFIWVYGDNNFHIEEVEVKGHLDLEWLQASIEKVVDQELAKVIL